MANNENKKNNDDERLKIGRDLITEIGGYLENKNGVLGKNCSIDKNEAVCWVMNENYFKLRITSTDSIDTQEVPLYVKKRFQNNKLEKERFFVIGKFIDTQTYVIEEFENLTAKIKKIEKDAGKSKSELIEKIKEVLGLMLMKKQLEDIIESGNKQIIFTGAPGTGKTYTARKHLEEKGKKQHEGYEFVQFHSSYDYTDFVEGLRPVRIDGNDNPTFVRMDGVFKEFCRKIVEKELEDFIEKMFKEEKIDKNLSANQKKILLDYYYMKEILSKHKVDKSEIETNVKNYLKSKNEDKNEDNNEYQKIIDEINEFIKENKAEENKAEENKAEENKAEENKAEENKAEENKAEENKAEDPDNNFYFIIDEINRADLSKVFGELMFGLEESYRGITNRFPTQYKNLKTYEIKKGGYADEMEFDCFEKGFFVPKNLIIIGTMNDIDRSVEAFDFALRRRFRWVEVDANTELDGYCNPNDGPDNENTKNKAALKEVRYRIEALNKYISGDLENVEKEKFNIDEKDDDGKKFNLNKSYQIGHAYFMDYNGNGANMVSIWKNRVEPILKEYCRGRDAGKFIENCNEILIPKNSAQDGE